MSTEPREIPVELKEQRTFRVEVEFVVGYKLPDNVTEEAVVRAIRNATFLRLSGPLAEVSR